MQGGDAPASSAAEKPAGDAAAPATQLDQPTSPDLNPSEPGGSEALPSESSPVGLQVDESMAAGISLEQSTPIKRNRFGLNYWTGYNVSVNFKRLGGFPRQTNPGPSTGGGFDRFYDNGFNRVDDSGNAGGYTWYWGYDDSSQVPGNDNLVLNSSESVFTTDKNDQDDGVTHGVELNYRRDLDQLWRGRWGLEGAFGWMRYNIENHSVLRTSATRISDSYVLSGVIPPLPPYQGSPEGPGPVIPDNPQRNVGFVTYGATVFGKREVEMDLFDFRVGPYWEVPLVKKLHASLSGGLAFAVVNSEFRYSEVVTIGGAGTVVRGGRSTDTDVLVGAFLAGGVRYSFTEKLDVFAGAQWQYLGDYTQKEGGKKAIAEFGGSVFVSVGLGYSF
jgi:hypothetical protein